MEENEIKKKIVRGAENLFTKYGVRSISMDDIARHLSVSKKTLYQHFEDKEDIVTSAVQSHIERIMGEFDAIQLSAVDAIDELPEREKLLMSLYHEQDLNLREIGVVMGITESRVCQLHSQAVARLRARLKNW